MDSTLLAIVGPTASGKSAVALQIAREQNGELISVDSRQIYRKLSVGTAKPPGRWTDGIHRVDGIPYHLVDIVEPDEQFSAAAFARAAFEKIAEIRERGHQPILVGGTGLYFKILSEGLAPIPDIDPAVRIRLHNRADRIGRAALHQELAKVDPVSARNIPANNIARLVRALEVYEGTGKPISDWHREHREGRANAPAKLKFNYVGIERSRQELHERIDARCHAMLSQGMVDETRELLAGGYGESCPALTGLGYPRVVAFLRHELTREQLLAQLIQDTRQYAKRQRTWFRNQMTVQWKTL